MIVASSQTRANTFIQRDSRAISRGHAQQSQGMALPREGGRGEPGTGACASNRGISCWTTPRAQGVVQARFGITAP